MASCRDEAQRHVRASPAELFDLLCQPETHVALDISGALHSAEGKTVQGVGDEFVLRMDPTAPPRASGLGNYEVTVVITQYSPEEALGWTMRAFGREATGYLWGYLLEPEGDGTLVTSYFDWSRAQESNEGTAFVPLFPEFGLGAMLGLLARLAEA